VVIATPDGTSRKGCANSTASSGNGAIDDHRTGHLFQGRYKAILVDADSYLLELTRYVVLNPVRAHVVDSPAKWPWNSYQAVMGELDAPA
jgi:putative transposase